MARVSFQSPSLRGSGRFETRREAESRAEAEFQSPSLRGSGRFATRLPPSLRGGARFNPLHCGAVVASFRLTAGFHFLLRVSIPFIAGQWSLPQRGG